MICFASNLFFMALAVMYSLNAKVALGLLPVLSDYHRMVRDNRKEEGGSLSEEKLSDLDEVCAELAHLHWPKIMFDSTTDEGEVSMFLRRLLAPHVMLTVPLLHWQ